MDQLISASIAWMANSHRQLAGILTSKRFVVEHGTRLIHVLPEPNPHEIGVDAVIDRSMQLTKSVSGFLNGLAELEEALAENLELVMKEIRVDNEE